MDGFGKSSFIHMCKNVFIHMCNQLIIMENILMPHLSEVPTFRFIGSKHYNLINILSVIEKENIDGESFFDVFSGTASVGAYFKKLYNIISNDNLYFSYILQKSLITLNDCPKFMGLKDIVSRNNSNNLLKATIDYLNNINIYHGFIYKHYTPASLEYDNIERKYFSEYNGSKIDSVRIEIENWKRESLINEDEYYYLLATLLFAVQKVANISGTYGSYNKIWDPRSKKTLNLKPIPIIKSKNIHKSYNANIFKIVENIYTDIAYLDPPYNSRQYISNYHVLETIARYDNPIINGKTGIRKYTDNDKSVFCSVNKASNKLLELLNKLNTRTILISYNSEGIMSKEDIIDIFKLSKYKFNKLYIFPYKRFKSNSKTYSNKIEEYIFTGGL